MEVLYLIFHGGFHSNKKEKLVAKLYFVIDTNGDITDIKINSRSDQFLGKQSKKALEKITTELQTKGKIEPAKYHDGTKLNLSYAIPVIFRCNDCLIENESTE